MATRGNLVAFPGVERELVLELAAVLARYGASAAAQERLRRARRPDAVLMRQVCEELQRLGAHHWLLAVLRAWHDGLSDFEALRTLKEMNSDRFDFN